MLTIHAPQNRARNPVVVAPPGEALWEGYYRRWQTITPPLRPAPDVCAAVRRLIAGHAECLLLLGVTPELSGFGSRTIAVDRSQTSLAWIWPGNASSRHGVRGDWMHLPCGTGRFSAAVGDGGLSCLEYPADYGRLFGELARAVRIGGRIVLRLYSRPAAGESVADVHVEALSGGIGTIHALKWRLAHALCAERGESNIAVRSILRGFNEAFHDRAALARTTGWSRQDIAQIDAYDGMSDVYSFPTVDQVLAVIPAGFRSPQIHPVGAYELADRCPLLVIDRTP